ncbi:hypothetical protein B9W62_22960 [Streptomyces sp. CS113]|nr:hypothetical protein B9W62_22960 [Streptomyces sp. CS113]
MTFDKRYDAISLELVKGEPPPAEAHWADVVQADRNSYGKTALKRHNPKTVRENAGDSCRGCLAIKVLKSADLYRRIEGSWYGIVLGADSAT